MTVIFFKGKQRGPTAKKKVIVSQCQKSQKYLYNKA